MRDLCSRLVMPAKVSGTNRSVVAENGTTTATSTEHNNKRKKSCESSNIVSNGTHRRHVTDETRPSSSPEAKTIIRNRFAPPPPIRPAVASRAPMILARHATADIGRIPPPPPPPATTSASSAQPPPPPPRRHSTFHASPLTAALLQQQPPPQQQQLLLQQIAEERRPSLPRSASDTTQLRLNIGANDGGGAVPSMTQTTAQSSPINHHQHHQHNDGGGSTRSVSNKEMPLIGVCRNCDREYSCRCCAKCSHMIIAYLPASKPRVSNITFSTVTSATGLPTIAAEPSRPRSSSYWKPIAASSCSSSNSASIGDQQQPLLGSTHRHRSSGGEQLQQSTFAQPPASMSSGAAVADVHHHIHHHHHQRHRNSSSDCGSSETTVAPEPIGGGVFAISEHDNSDSSAASSHSSCDISDAVIQTVDGTLYDTQDLDADRLLARTEDWSFPMFDLANVAPKTALSKLAYTIFKRSDLFRIFKIVPTKFFNFFHALEGGYWNIPYHNRLHAADVMHSCYFLSTKAVNTFASGAASMLQPQSPPTSPDPRCGDADDEQQQQTPMQPLADSMSTLELMALYTAAAMHDYDHPGRTNAFLVAAEDRKAIFYNDRSVLENHHAAESWRLLCQTQNYFIDTLDAAETKRFRYLVLEYILATDLKQHFDIIMQFNEKVADMDLANESDRVLVSQMIIKFADINSPSKSFDLHRQWTVRICEEFYEQGDEEKRRGMALSPYMDRNEPQVAKLQDSFIAHIVLPLAVALNEVGLLPTTAENRDESELITNLKSNHQYWLNELSTTAVDDDDAASSQQQPDDDETAESCSRTLSKRAQSHYSTRIDEESSASPPPPPSADDDDPPSNVDKCSSATASLVGGAVEDKYEITTIQEQHNEDDEEYL